jgi:hypothetical protein
VGIEDIDDLVTDLEQALTSAGTRDPTAMTPPGEEAEG